MSGDYIKTFKLEVEIQENGIIRDPFGWIIGRCDDDWLKLVTRHELNSRAKMSYEDALILLDELGLSERTCKYVIEDNMNESEGMGDVWFRCTNCHTIFDYYADDWLMKQNYCPHCGAKVVA